MGHHTFDVANADRLERPGHRFRFLSAEELRRALAADPGDVVLDLGSGTGFYTDVVASDAGGVIAIDVQEAMHEYYRDKGKPDAVDLVTGDVDRLPLAAAGVDRAFSTMTYHEFASADAIAEIDRVLRSGGRLAIVDWAATGTGEHGPPVAERYTAEEAAAALRDGGFEIDHVAERSETFLLVATAP